MEVTAKTKNLQNVALCIHRGFEKHRRQVVWVLHNAQGFRSQYASISAAEPGLQAQFLPHSVIQLHLLLGAGESCSQVGDQLSIHMKLVMLPVCFW